MKLVPERDALPRLLAFVYAPLIAGAWWLVQRGLLWPPGSRSCALLDHAGIACPTCGGVRAVRALGAGAPLDALRQHPLVTLGLAAAALWLVYAVAATLVPRWRRSLVFTAREATGLRRGALGAILAVWAYEVVRHL